MLLLLLGAPWLVCPDVLLVSLAPCCCARSLLDGHIALGTRVSCCCCLLLVAHLQRAVCSCAAVSCVYPTVPTAAGHWPHPGAAVGTQLLFGFNCFGKIFFIAYVSVHHFWVFFFFLLPFKFSSLLCGFVGALGQACCQTGAGSWCKFCARGVDQAPIFASVIINAFLHLLEPLPLSHWQLNWKPTAALLWRRFAPGANDRLKLTQIMILIGLIFASGFRKKAGYFSPSSSLVSSVNLCVAVQAQRLWGGWVLARGARPATLMSRRCWV